MKITNKKPNQVIDKIADNKAMEARFIDAINELKAIPEGEGREAAAKEYYEKLGFDQESVKELSTIVKNNLPMDKVIEQVAQSENLPIRLMSEENNTNYAMEGLRMLNSLMPFTSPKNGNKTFDYNLRTPAEVGLGGLGANTVENLHKNWIAERQKRANESYMCTLGYHKSASKYMLGLDASHNSTALAAAHINDMFQQINVPLEEFRQAFRALVLWFGEYAETAFTNVTDPVTGFDHWTLPDTAKKADDKTITAYNGSGNALIQLLNTYIESLRVPADDLLVGDSATEFLINFGTESAPDMQQLDNRFLDTNKAKIIAPIELREVIKQAVKTQSLAQNAPEWLATIDNIFVFIPYELFEKFGHITGLKRDIHVDEAGKVSGEATILLITPQMYQLMEQFADAETFNTGAARIVFNYWSYIGVATQKDRDMFKQQIGLKVEAGPAPTPTPTRSK